MKHILLATLIVGFLIMNTSAKDLKVLMIGNSFSISVTKHLDKIVRAVPGNELYLASMYIGGCPFERHWKNVEELSKKPDFKPYTITIRDTRLDAKSQPKNFSANIPEMLKKEKWDIVTIQQASHASWNYATYQPYADKLIALIRELAPQAKIHIQQTWSYRADDGRLCADSKNYWGFDQNGMYDRLTKAYQELAQKHHLAIIPTGLAVQKFRATVPADKKFKPLSSEAVANFKKGDALPDQYGDMAGNTWYDAKKKALRSDTIHLNRRGEYLQGCVWFGALYGISPEKADGYRPIFMKADEAALLRKCAAEAVRDFPQVR